MLKLSVILNLRSKNLDVRYMRRIVITSTKVFQRSIKRLCSRTSKLASERVDQLLSIQKVDLMTRAIWFHLSQALQWWHLVPFCPLDKFHILFQLVWNILKEINSDPELLLNMVAHIDQLRKWLICINKEKRERLYHWCSKTLRLDSTKSQWPPQVIASFKPSIWQEISTYQKISKTSPKNKRMISIKDSPMDTTNSRIEMKWKSLLKILLAIEICWSFLILVMLRLSYSNRPPELNTTCFSYL